MAADGGDAGDHDATWARRSEVSFDALVARGETGQRVGGTVPERGGNKGELHDGLLVIRPECILMFCLRSKGMLLEMMVRSPVVASQRPSLCLHRHHACSQLFFPSVTAPMD